MLRKTFEAKYGPLRDVCIRFHRVEDDVRVLCAELGTLRS